MRSRILGLIAASFIGVPLAHAQDWQTGAGGAIGGGAGAAIGSAVGGRTGAAVGGALGGAAGGAATSSGDAQTGAVVGGALGGAAGGVIGHNAGGTAGAAVGGAIGGGAGAMIGSSVTGSDARSSAPTQSTTQPQPAPRAEAPVREVHDHHYYDEGPAKKHKKKNVPKGKAYGWHRNQGY